MIVQVPKSVDVNQLLSQMDLSKTRRRNIKNKIYYFLSRVVLTNHNYKLYENFDWYRKVNSTKMNKILRRDYKLIFEILKNKEDPIIMSNNSYRTEHYSKGYRLTHKYNTGEVEYKTLPKRFDNLINEITEEYEFITNQFNKHQLTIDKNVNNYIKNTMDLLLDKTENDNEVKLVYNKIGRWLEVVNKINNNEIWRNISSKNKRLNSGITNLNKSLRPFLLCNEEQLIIIDIKASQPYILSSILNFNFIQDDIKGYNLNTIYNHLYDNFNDGKDNKGDIRDTGSLMFARFLNDVNDSLNDYKGSPFHHDFYSYIHSSVYHTEPTKEQRNEIKKNMMFFLFENNLGHRNHNDSIIVIARRFPIIDSIIKMFLSVIGKKRFSYLLQRTESYLVLDCICREFLTKFPEAPLFTIHDACMTTSKYVDELYQIMEKILRDVTGIVPGLTIKYPSLELNPNEDDIIKWYDKIHKNGKPYRYKKMKRSVFSSNIERATEFQKEYCSL